MEINMDDVVEAFQCQICLEVVYKPVVQACGHVFCFWCLHKAMSHSGTSNCPVCRNLYHHLPRVCELLHYLLLKAFPKEYEKRAEEVSEWERKMGTFSLQLGTLDSNGQEDEVLELGKDKGTFSPQMGTLDLNVQASAGTSFSESKLRVSDVLCAHCKELIYRPIVLNCGHAFCESCVNYNVFKGTTLKCQVCQSFHPAKSRAVCLELHHFLQSMFTVEYAEREKSILLQNKQPKKESPTDEIAETSSQMETVVHLDFGCDNCGFCPIVGKRFNQHHKAEHQFEEVAERRVQRFIFLGGDTLQFI
ncbi:E3 ubiquitin-protein ligase PRT1-like [Cryptomeria japonica]|uniref:E3 ubiquitin-protein ligase PRT1-like n=1 Tax=Cryptomeria japonica TaxID=3369 RepID=UPI0027DA2F72|nr:E3 ubiquitin-protein ligase PRT1-like [Cryptomeria japonica]